MNLFFVIVAWSWVASFAAWGTLLLAAILFAFFETGRLEGDNPLVICAFVLVLFGLVAASVHLALRLQARGRSL